MINTRIKALEAAQFSAFEGQLVADQGPKGFTPAGIVAAWAAVPVAAKAGALVAGTVGLGFGAEEVLGG
ncbi:hypothetical protein [Rhodococcus qingshengii]|uniref:hypothetical protein n=1 Tax=Rhodococcus qingshengii TaxID=334542 RepID=UPI003016BF03